MKEGEREREKGRKEADEKKEEVEKRRGGGRGILFESQFRGEQKRREEAKKITFFGDKEAHIALKFRRIMRRKLALAFSLSSLLPSPPPFRPCRHSWNIALDCYQFAVKARVTRCMYLTCLPLSQNLLVYYPYVSVKKSIALLYVVYTYS